MFFTFLLLFCKPLFFFGNKLLLGSHLIWSWSWAKLLSESSCCSSCCYLGAESTFFQLSLLLFQICLYLKLSETLLLLLVFLLHSFKSITIYFLESSLILIINLILNLIPTILISLKITRSIWSQSMLWLFRIVLHHFVIQIFVHSFLLQIAVVWCTVHLTILGKVRFLVYTWLSPLCVCSSTLATISTWDCFITVFEWGRLTRTILQFLSRRSWTYILSLVIVFIDIISIFIWVLTKSIVIICVN